MNKTVTLIVLTVAVLGVGLILMVAMSLVFNLILTVLFGETTADNWGFLSTVAFFLLPWGKLRTRTPYVIRATSLINAPRAQVWEAIHLHPRRDYYLSTLKTVEDLGQGRYRLISDPTLSPDDTRTKIDVQVTASETGHLLRYHLPDPSALPLWGKDLSGTEITLADTGDGGTRVEVRETLTCLRITSFLSLLFLNPVADSLKSLKARCEGTPSQSWLDAEAQAAAAGVPGLTEKAGGIVMITASVVITFMMLGIFALIFWAIG